MHNECRRSGIAMRWSRPLAIVVLLQAVLIALLTGTSTALADVICAPNRTPDDYFSYVSHFAVWERNPMGPALGGVYAATYHYTPYVTPIGSTPGVNDETVEQVGLEPATDATIIQAGFEVYQGSVYHDFCENYDASTGHSIKHEYFSGTGNITTYYTALYGYDHDSQGNPQLTCQDKGVSFDRITPQRTNLTYTRANVFGEIHDWTSQMPGTGSDNAWFSDAHIYCGCVGGWTFFGAHSPGSSQDYQCAEFSESGGLSCVTVDVNSHGSGGGSYYDGAWGTNVFERTITENTLYYGDLTAPCT